MASCTWLDVAVWECHYRQNLLPSIAKKEISHCGAVLVVKATWCDEQHYYSINLVNSMVVSSLPGLLCACAGLQTCGRTKIYGWSPRESSSRLFRAELADLLCQGYPAESAMVDMKFPAWEFAHCCCVWSKEIAEFSQKAASRGSLPYYSLELKKWAYMNCWTCTLNCSGGMGGGLSRVRWWHTGKRDMPWLMVSPWYMGMGSSFKNCSSGCVAYLIRKLKA